VILLYVTYSNIKLWSLFISYIGRKRSRTKLCYSATSVEGVTAQYVHRHDKVKSHSVTR